MSIRQRRVAKLADSIRKFQPRSFTWRRVTQRHGSCCAGIILINPPITSADLARFAEGHVNLPKDVADARRAKVRDLREQLGKWIKEHPDCGLAKSYLSGSLAKGTALRTSSDVDLALYIYEDGVPKAFPELLAWIAERLRKAYPQMSPDQIVPQEYSVKITFKGAGFDVDIVPVLYNNNPDGKGWLISKWTGRRMMTSIPMHLAFIRKRKKDHAKLAQIVRLLKWWAEEQKQADANFRLKSFMVELVCCRLADDGHDMSDYLRATTSFFNYVVGTGLSERIYFTDHYPASRLTSSSDPVQIFDPVNPDNNVACRYSDSHRRKITAAAQNALDAINEAHTAATKKHAVEMWKEVLGPSFRG